MLAFASMNTTTGSVPITLVCHPQSPAEAIDRIEVLVDVAPDDTLTLAFVLESDLSRLCIPEPRTSGPAEGLWRHTCFEAFVMAGEGPGYREFNFSPSGEWTIHAFRGYREGEKPDDDPGPEIKVRRTGDRLELDAAIRPDCLPPGRSLRLGLSAVLEHADGVMSYWALRHPPGKPDFHHIDAFALQLEMP